MEHGGHTVSLLYYSFRSYFAEKKDGMNRIQLIFNEKWAMTEADYFNLVSLIIPSVKAGRLKEVEEQLEKPSVNAYASDINFVNKWELDDPSLPYDSVAVITLEGTLYSWETIRLQRFLDQANENDHIAGIILWINGPGGMVANLDNAAAAISASPKPVIAYIAGMCASAHYWVASAARKRYLGSLMSEVGSIGIVGIYYSEKKALEQMGIDYRTIYPDTADLKNKEHREIEENNNEEPYKEKLEKIHQLFCQTVAKNLSIPYDRENPIFRGKTFMGEEAVKAGLADGYCDLDTVARMILAQSVMDKTKLFT